jgi:hypothetical protein
VAATYVSTLLTAKDRVRFMIYDKAATFTFQDEEIAYTLTLMGFEGDPLAELPPQELPEILAAIALLESVPTGATGDSTTIKQGSVTRTNATGIGNRSSILLFLRRRLALIGGLANGDNGGPVVVDGYANFPCETTVTP